MLLLTDSKIIFYFVFRLFPEILIYIEQICFCFEHVLISVLYVCTCFVKDMVYLAVLQLFLAIFYSKYNNSA